MDINELEVHLDHMVRALKLRSKKAVLGRDSAVQYVIEDFGVVITGIYRVDYSDIDNILQNRFENWRLIYVATEDDLNEKRLEVIWELMRSGYMKWIRLNFPREFSNLMSEQNFGNKIIEERLKIWADQPRYKFFIEDNKSAKKYSAQMILAQEPGFFDYMP